MQIRAMSLMSCCCTITPLVVCRSRCTFSLEYLHHSYSGVNHVATLLGKHQGKWLLQDKMLLVLKLWSQPVNILDHAYSVDNFFDHASSAEAFGSCVLCNFWMQFTLCRKTYDRQKCMCHAGPSYEIWVHRRQNLLDMFKNLQSPA